MTAPCPKCGHNFEADRIIYRDGWMIDPSGRVAFKGPVLNIKVTWAGILHALAASPGLVSHDALLNRVSDSDNINVIAVQVCKLRRWLRERGIPDPIHQVKYTGGYRWSAPVQSPVHGAI